MFGLADTLHYVKQLLFDLLQTECFDFNIVIKISFSIKNIQNWKIVSLGTLGNNS